MSKLFSTVESHPDQNDTEVEPWLSLSDSSCDYHLRNFMFCVKSHKLSRQQPLLLPSCKSIFHTLSHTANKYGFTFLSKLIVFFYIICAKLIGTPGNSSTVNLNESYVHILPYKLISDLIDLFVIHEYTSCDLKVYFLQLLFKMGKERRHTIEEVTVDFHKYSHS